MRCIWMQGQALHVRHAISRLRVIAHISLTVSVCLCRSLVLFNSSSALADFQEQSLLQQGRPARVLLTVWLSTAC